MAHGTLNPTVGAGLHLEPPDASGSPSQRCPAAPAAPGVGERLHLLRSMPLFDGMETADLLPLATAAEHRVFEAGAHLVRQGEPGDSVFLIISGRVQSLTRYESEGIVTEVVVSWLGPGDTVGELSLLDGAPRSASYVATEATTCLRLGRIEFLAAVQRHWPLCRALLGVLAQRLRTADVLVAEHARDPVTGLYSRRALQELYERGVARARRVVTGAAGGAADGGQEAARPMAVLFIDIDRFKEINDRYGHHTGDEVLRAVAMTLSACTRTSDLVARHGGDEFVILLPGANAESAARVAARIRGRLEQRPPGPVPFTVSVGTAVVDQREPTSLDALLRQADEAMYQDKARRAARG
jgi:diguanylate cyclase (GGDEF)-like protein